MSAGLLLNGRFRLIEELGRGGMGAVWRAEDLELEAPAAVKLIDAQFVQSPEALARFKREAKAAAAIRSTHVVQILECGVDDQIPYIAMELLKGETLAKRIETLGALTPEMTLNVLTHVGRALSLAHKNGIVHRDLKPDNVFLVREMDEDIGKVLDFGIARKLGALGDTGGFQTQTGAVLGTPYYMSPEHTMGQFVDQRSDIWSLGVITFECLTGKLPFEHDSLGGLFRAICVAPPPVPSQVGPVPVGFDEWFARATARDPNDRFQSVNEAVASFRGLCRQPSTRATPMTNTQQRGDSNAIRPITPFERSVPPVQDSTQGQGAGRRRWVIAGAALAVAAVAILSALHWLRRPSQPPSNWTLAVSTIVTEGIASPPMSAAPPPANSGVMPLSGEPNALPAAVQSSRRVVTAHAPTSATTRRLSRATAKQSGSQPSKQENVAGF